MAKEGGEEGKEKIQRITRYVSIILAFVESIGIMMGLRGALLSTSVFSYITIGIQLAAGSAVVMWMAEKITEKGIGNGMSLIIFVGIVSRLPLYVVELFTNIFNGTQNAWVLLPILVISVGIVAGVVCIDNAERRITVQYAKRVVGRKMYGGQSTHIPMKLNASGVLPIIFAMTLLQFPLMISQFWPQSGFTIWYQGFMYSGGIPYSLLYGLLIFAFSFFYMSISFNPIEIQQESAAERRALSPAPAGPAHQRLSCQDILPADLFRRYLPGHPGHGTDHDRILDGIPDGHAGHRCPDLGECGPGDHQTAGDPSVGAPL